MKKAFTLIELLVVITIIVVIFSLVMTAGPKVLAIARTRSCLNNVRQLCTAAIAYSNDDAYGRMPGPCPRAKYQDNRGNTAGGNRLTSWDKALARKLGIENRPRNFYDRDVVRDFGEESGKNTYYTSALKVFTCVEDPSYAITQNAEGIIRSYLLNIGKPGEVNREGDAIYANRITNPQETILFMECHKLAKEEQYKYFGSANGEGITYLTTQNAAEFYEDEDGEYIMHGTSGNPLFTIGTVDGGARTITVDELTSDDYFLMRHRK